MLQVVQADLAKFGFEQRQGEQVLQAEDFSDNKSPLAGIREVTREALKTAGTQGLKSLIIPVINSRPKEIAMDTLAKIMVAEARRHLSLKLYPTEITFALADAEGVQAFQRVIERDKIVCLGDSITYGYPDGPDYSWVKLLAAATGLNLLNRGISGETTGQMLARFNDDVVAEQPAYVIFAGGHNDGWMGVPLGEVEDNIRQVVEQAQQQGVCPILVLPAPLNVEQLLQNFQGTREEAEKYQAILQQIRNWIAQFAEASGIFALDFYSPLLGSDGQGLPHLLLDGGHPTHEGYRVLGEAAIQQLQGRLYFPNTSRSA